MNPTKRHNLWQALFHPFLTIAGPQALALGLALMALTAWLGSLSHTHFDGVLDVHSGGQAPLWFYFAEVLMDWLCAAVAFLAVGRLLSRSKFRSIDLIGTQALARWPMLWVSLACLAPGYSRYTLLLMKSVQQMMAQPQKAMFPPVGPDTFVFALVLLVTLVSTVWMVALMWKSFSHCCNVRGGKAVGAFVGGLVVAEVLSKAAIVWMVETVFKS